MRKNHLILKSLFVVIASITSVKAQAQEFNRRAQEMLRQSIENEKTPSLRYFNSSIFASTPSISGSDDTWSSVDIRSKLSLGVKLGYTYIEESITARAELSYRSVDFKKDDESGTTVDNNSDAHDIGFSYYITHQTWEKVKLVIGLKYQNLYYFQNKLGQNAVEVKSKHEAIPSFGAEWMAWKTAEMNLSPYALLGASLPTADVKVGSNYQLGFKFNHVYTANYSIIGDLSYSETHNKTSVTQFTTDSSQKHNDLNLQLGLQKEF